jgi:hypothetical protein
MCNAIPFQFSAAVFGSTPGRGSPKEASDPVSAGGCIFEDTADGRRFFQDKSQWVLRGSLRRALATAKDLAWPSNEADTVTKKGTQCGFFMPRPSSQFLERNPTDPTYLQHADRWE